MDIPMGVDVYCVNDVVGTSVRVILNPISERVTHVVVREKGFPEDERLVPIEHIIEGSPTLIRFDLTVDEFKNMPLFIEREFIPAPYPLSSPDMVWPYAVPEFPLITLEHERVPPDELAVRRGSDVIAKDGKVGRVDEFLIDLKTGHITHLILKEGHLWGQKEVTIPVSEIAKIEENVVYLKVDKQWIQDQPAIPIRKREVNARNR